MSALAPIIEIPPEGYARGFESQVDNFSDREIFVRLLADHVGGASGCTHLFDLSVDCLRLFDFSA